MYVCGNCGKSIKTLDGKFIRCPYCGHRVLFKTRSGVAREISTD